MQDQISDTKIIFSRQTIYFLAAAILLFGVKCGEHEEEFTVDRKTESENLSNGSKNEDIGFSIVNSKTMEFYELLDRLKDFDTSHTNLIEISKEQKTEGDRIENDYSEHSSNIDNLNSEEDIIDGILSSLASNIEQHEEYSQIDVDELSDNDLKMMGNHQTKIENYLKELEKIFVEQSPNLDGYLNESKDLENETIYELEKLTELKNQLEVHEKDLDKIHYEVKEYDLSLRTLKGDLEKKLKTHEKSKALSEKTNLFEGLKRELIEQYETLENYRETQEQQQNELNELKIKKETANDVIEEFENEINEQKRFIEELQDKFNSQAEELKELNDQIVKLENFLSNIDEDVEIQENIEQTIEILKQHLEDIEKLVTMTDDVSEEIERKYEDLSFLIDEINQLDDKLNKLNPDLINQSYRLDSLKEVLMNQMISYSELKNQYEEQCYKASNPENESFQSVDSTISKNPTELTKADENDVGEIDDVDNAPNFIYESESIEGYRVI